MDRQDAILKYTTKEQRGIEIGPWFNPIAPKREGYRCLSLDVFDLETLRKRAVEDPNIAAESIPMIEDVDRSDLPLTSGNWSERAGRPALSITSCRRITSSTCRIRSDFSRGAPRR